MPSGKCLPFCLGLNVLRITVYMHARLIQASVNNSIMMNWKTTVFMGSLNLNWKLNNDKTKLSFVRNLMYLIAYRSHCK